MTNNRPIKKLWEICSIITKWSTPTTYGFSFLTEWINFVKVENITKWRINHKSIDNFIWQDAHDSQKRSQLEEWDILFSIAWTIWNTAIVKKEDLPANINQAIAIIRWFSKSATSEFMKTILSSQVAELLKKKARWWALQNISLTDIKEFTIPLPPLSIQKQIVAKLDEAFVSLDESIALIQANIDKIEEMNKSVLDKVFEKGEWKRVKIEKLIEKTELWNPVGKPNEKFDYIDISSIDNKIFSIRETKEILGKDAPSRAKKLVEKWDILYATTRPNLKNIALCEINKSHLTCSTWFCVLRTKEKKLFNRYLFYCVITDIFFKKIEKYIRGAQYPAVSDRDIKNIEIPLPSLEKQQEIVKYLDKVFAQTKSLKSEYETKLTHLKALKASILQSAFEGKLL